ncbi:MAG: pitrilysin family protein [bacterium]|nr:pitrilysin family protein [bacterium]
MFYKEVLKNGLRIVCEEISHVTSVSIGVWVNVGSKNEKPENNGISHFIEHMMFKGTPNRSAREVAATMDRVGGVLGAFTEREYTCYHAKVISKYFPLAIDLLSDMVLNSLFEKKEIAMEKQVVIEEIKMYEDTPDELIHDLFAKTIWNNHSLGQPIIGTSEVINSLNREVMVDFRDNMYHPEKIVISVAGNIKHQEVFEEIRKAFEGLEISSSVLEEKAPQINPCIYNQKKDCEQMHLCIGTIGLPYTHEDRYTLYLLNNILGGGMSSRLFYEIREKEGLAYAVYSYQASFSPSGFFTTYLGTSPKNYHKAIKIVLDEFSKVKNKKIKGSELNKAKENIKGNMMLSMENTSNRMSRIAKQELYFNKYFTIEETIERIEDVQAKDILDIASYIFQEKYLTIAAIGPLSDQECKVEISLFC